MDKIILPNGTLVDLQDPQCLTSLTEEEFELLKLLVKKENEMFQEAA